MAGSVTPTRGVFKGRTFPSYRQYRNALAQQKGFASWYAQQRAPKPIRTPHTAELLKPAEREARQDALRALTLMRHGKPLAQVLKDGISNSAAALARNPRPLSLAQAARKAHALASEPRPLSLAQAAKAAQTTPNAVLRYVGSALRKDARGRYVAKARDKLYRPMRFLTPNGTIILDVQDSRTASRIAKYMNAVRRYAVSGNDSALTPFRGQSVQLGGIRYEFVTDLDVLDRLSYAGELHFEDLYALAA